jgi:hypothetical protein
MAAYWHDKAEEARVMAERTTSKTTRQYDKLAE